MRKKLWSMSIFLLLLGAALKVNITGVAAVPTSPYIMVVPEKTVDPSLTPGMNYTVSMYTDYDGNDTWAWQFSLTYNPDVLHGGINTTDTWIGDNVTQIFNATRTPIVKDSEKVYVNQVLMTRNVNYTIDHVGGKITFAIAPSLGAEVKAIYLGSGVVNGDLITKEKSPRARFIAGQFDNTLGKLSLTGARFHYVNDWNSSTIDTDVTSGPGTFAYVTFTVVDTGISNITLGEKTQLKGCDITTDPPTFYNIIDAKTMPDHIGHGYFDNLPPIHNVAVTRLDTLTTAVPGDIVGINVTARNRGNYTETFHTTVYANNTLVGNQTVSNLTRGGKTTLTFNWNTTSKIAGNYTINATTWLLEDAKPEDNWQTTTIEIKSVHDVAIVSLEISTEAIVGELVVINVTVANQGIIIEENVNLTISYIREIGRTKLPPIVIKTTNFTLAERPASKIFSVDWNTTGLNTQYEYTINATVTIARDDDPSDNTETKFVPFKWHDVAITDISTKSIVFVGTLLTINVTVRNVGGLNETLVKVKVTIDGNVIGSQNISLPQGNSKTLSFTWNTTSVDPTLYQVKAEATIPGDANPTDNQRFTTIGVETPKGQINGIVKDASTGNPIEDAKVTVNGYSDITDANGQYNITNVPAGTYTVTASAGGYQTSSQTGVSVEAGQTTNLNFTLTPLPTTGRITGNVTDASTGNPIEDAKVTVEGHSVSVSTNAAGYYSIELPPGKYNVTASADGYETATKTDVNVVAGVTTPVDFKLLPIPQSNMSLYIIIAAVGIIVMAGTVFYLRKGKKTT